MAHCTSQGKELLRNSFYKNSLVAQMVKNLPAVQETGVKSLGHKDSLEKGMQTTAVFLPGKSHGQGRLAGYSLCDRKSQTQLSDYTTTFSPNSPPIQAVI